MTTNPSKRTSPDRGHEFSEGGSLHKFRTEIPNTIIRGVKSRGLSVHAKWLYVYFKSVCGDEAECYRTTSTIAEESGLSRTMVSTAKRELAAKGLIILTKSKNPNRQADHIHIKNIWDANMQEFCVPLANALNVEDDKELEEDEADSVPLVNADPAQRSISERSVPLANSGVLLANQRRSLEEDPNKKNTSPIAPAPDTSHIRNFEAGFSPPPSKRCPATFKPDPAIWSWAQEKYPDVDVDEALDAMKDYEFARPRDDWNATLRTWIRNEAKGSVNGHRRRSQKSTDPDALATALQKRLEEEEHASQ